MSTTYTDTPVPQPIADFGAVRGQNRYGRWLVITPAWVAVFAFTVVAYHVPNFLNNFDAERQTSVAGLALAATVIGGIILLAYTHEVFTHADQIFRQNFAAGRDLWAGTVFRDWLNARYGAEFTAAAAEHLVRGGSAHVYRPNGNGGTERVQVYLDGIDPLANLVGLDSVGKIPDLGSLHDDLTLMVVEAPVKPAVHAW